MLSHISYLFAVLIIGLVAADSGSNVGYSGVLSSLDGGLQGTVTVQDPSNLIVQNYELGDGDAPALYWWGSTTASLRSGFRISEERVGAASSGGDLKIPLDSGKTSANFVTVGLWCERFGVNYGQTMLKASDSADAAAGGDSLTTTSNSPSSVPAIPSPKSSSSSSQSSASESSQFSGDKGAGSILQNAYNTARTYFLCVIGLLLVESSMYLPSYLATAFKKDPIDIGQPSHHSRLYLLLLRITTNPLVVSGMISITLPDFARLLALLGLNLLWGWNRNKYSADFDLYGWLTLANGGLALQFAARNNLFAVLLRIPLTTLLFYHRWIGRATVVHATIHMANLVNSYVETGQFSMVIQTVHVQVGLMAWISLCLIVVTSISLIRRRTFEVFYYVHGLFALFIIGALIHATHAPEFLVPGLSLWVIDRLVRFQHNFQPIKIIAVTQYPGNLTKFKIKGTTLHYPGQVAWLQIPGASILNWHPFTIASPPSDSKEATFAIRTQGNYTRRVQRLATGTTQEKAALSETAQTNMGDVLPTSLRIRVDGPYGVGKIRWGQQPLTIIVAGGSGMTPGLSIAGFLLDEAKKAATRSSRGKSHVQILWVVKASEHIAWFEEELVNMMIVAADPSLPISMDLAIYVTGSAYKASESGKLSGNGVSQLDDTGFLHRHNYVHVGRPDIRVFFQDMRLKYSGLDAAVSVCGPQQLVNAVGKEAVAGDTREKGVGAYYVEAVAFVI